MLVLSRKVGQELTIGDNIRITVNRICGNRVVLGIVAPQSTRVLRGELEPFAPSFEVEVETSLEEGVAVPAGAAWIVTGESSLEVMARHTH
jgi:carbon storage regulator CsrA